MKKEIFKSIECAPDYEISNLGRVKSLKPRKPMYLKLLKASIGYPQVCLRTDNKIRRLYIHRLLAYAFMGYDIDDKTMVVDHIDGNSMNYSLSNLQIITHRENLSKRKDRRSSTGVRKQNNRYYVQVYINGVQEYLGGFDTEEQASMAYNNRLNF